MLIELTFSYSSCVEHLVQRLLLAISDHVDLHIYGGDASDAFSHIPGPSVPTFVYIDDQFGKNIDREKFLTVTRALHGYLDSGRLC